MQKACTRCRRRGGDELFSPAGFCLACGGEVYRPAKSRRYRGEAGDAVELRYNQERAGHFVRLVPDNRSEPKSERQCPTVVEAREVWRRWADRLEADGYVEEAPATFGPTASTASASGSGAWTGD